MPVAIVLAAAVILCGVIVVAMGKGGELSRERAELPVRTDFRSWSDVADYRPPAALLGYHAAATERALMLIARTIAERDAEIEWLRRRLAEVQPQAESGLFDDALAIADTDPAQASQGALGQSEAAQLAQAASTAQLAQSDQPGDDVGWQSASATGTGIASGFWQQSVGRLDQPVGRRASEDE